MWFIGVSSVGDYAATRFWLPFYRKHGGRRHGFETRCGDAQACDRGIAAQVMVY
jgi:hypothetical protein